jgi:hypothetical protein
MGDTGMKSPRVQSVRRLGAPVQRGAAVEPTLRPSGRIVADGGGAAGVVRVQRFKFKFFATLVGSTLER